MTSYEAQPKARNRNRMTHPVRSALLVLGLNAFLGPIAYFVAFLMAYGFRDTVGWEEHLLFLALIAIFALVCAPIALLSTSWEPEATPGQLFKFGVLASFSVSATAVGIGSVVSALNKSQGSVSASFSTTTDVLVALGLFVSAGTCAGFARIVQPRPASAGKSELDRD